MRHHWLTRGRLPCGKDAGGGDQDRDAPVDQHIDLRPVGLQTAGDKDLDSADLLNESEIEFSQAHGFLLVADASRAHSALTHNRDLI